MRAAKLVINTHQNRVDNFTLTGAMIGSVTGLVWRRSLGGLLRGSSLGVATAVVVHLNMDLWEMIKEKL